MNAENHIVVLIGSPKANKSTSESLANYLIDRLSARGAHAQIIHVSKAMRSVEGLDSMISAVDKADVLILVSPLYVDSLPYPVTKAFELISDYRQEIDAKRPQRLIAIFNCGFPEAHQNDTALAICRLFAREAGFEWAGGLALGMGGTIDGQEIERLGGMLRNVKRSLELVADAIAMGKSLPPDAAELMAKPSVPKWLYVMVGNFGWKSTSKRYGAYKNIWARPYETGLDQGSSNVSV